MKKRLTVWFITAAMFLSQLVPMGQTAFAYDYGPVTITSKINGPSDLKPGGKFYVDVSISPMSSCAFALNSSWDTKVLELTNAFGKSNSNAESTSFTYVPFYQDGSVKKSEQALIDYQNSKTKDVCVFAYASGENLTSGYTVTLEFTVKQNAKNGSSPINIYFDEQNLPASFDSDYSSSEVEVSKDTGSGQSSKVTPVISNPPQPPETGVTRPFEPGYGSFGGGIYEPPFTTTKVNAQDEIDELDDDYTDDVSAAAGTTDTAGKSTKTVAIVSTAILAAVFVFLITKKQKQRNNSSDRIK